MSDFYERLQAARAQQFAQRDNNNQMLWNALSDFPANVPTFEQTPNPALAEVRNRRAAEMSAPQPGSMVTGVPMLDAPLDQVNQPPMAEMADPRQMIMQGFIPPALPKRGIASDVAQAQQAARTGDDLASFPTERNLPKSAENKVRKQYESQIDKYMNQREKLIQNMQDRAKIIRESENQLDLSPIMALIDSETGSNFSRVYQAPLNAAQKERLAQNLESRASQGLGALASLQQQQRNQALLNEKWKRDNMIRERIANIRGGAKPMSGEQIKRLDYVVGAEDALNRLETAVNDPNVTMRPDIPFVGDNTFTEALRDAAENYGRMQSGGAISKDEEKRFLAKVYKIGDSREDVLRKIKQFRQEMKGRRTRLLSGGRNVGQTSPEVEAVSFDVDSFLGS
jgi:hypothetical protein